MSDHRPTWVIGSAMERSVRRTDMVGTPRVESDLRASHAGLSW